MSFSVSLSSGNPRCFLSTDEGKRNVQGGLEALGRAAKSLLRSTFALSMVGLSVVEPRLLPLFAMTVPFWIALELEGRLDANLARRFTPR